MTKLIIVSYIRETPRLREFSSIVELRREKLKLKKPTAPKSVNSSDIL